ncbi:hypothetical protein BJ969_003451 [Saccharopolyspora gloriosae]|uniref:Uncharacterized protein n=1 Tax=Saccharopolyspora gloriosae TaxID=455344 RepID=A0A840NJM3_9PSEU|nr:hypothetical protein [Saccharopolyspora gloriosae]
MFSSAAKPLTGVAAEVPVLAPLRRPRAKTSRKIN